MKFPLRHGRQSAFEKQISLAKRKLFFLKAKLFLLIILPVSIITLGKAVITEYAKIKLRRIAAETPLVKAPAAKAENQPERRP